VFSLLALFLAVWTVASPYSGLVHDAQLYALQTAAKLKPEIFLGDLFLRYGSQDDFTIFPWIYAPLAWGIGLEPAAAALTFAASIAWLALGFMIAREISGTRLALLSLGLLTAIPGWYGAYKVFEIGEVFLSARLPAEVLAIGGLLCYLRGRILLAITLCIASALIHPLMALPMMGLLILMPVRSHAGPRIARLAVLAAIAGGTLAAFLIPAEPIERFDDWLSILKTRSLFLFPTLWRFADWQQHLLTLATLVLASQTSAEARTKTLTSCAAWIGVAGVILAIIAEIIPEHPSLLQAQPWRWVWISSLLAIIVLPQVLHDLWRGGSGSAERSAAMLIATAWLLADSVGGLVAIIAIGVLSQADRTSERSQLWLTRTAWTALGATILGTIVGAVQLASYPLDTNREPMWIQRAVNLVSPTQSSILIVAACWAVAMRSRARAAPIALTLLAVVALIALGPRAARTWSTFPHSGESHQVFALWRSIIPEDAEVLWPGDMMATWLLLERRSYFSSDQLAGLLYSPSMTPELQQRAAALSSLVNPDWWTLADWRKEAQPRQLTAGILADLCRAPELDYFVAATNVGGAISTIRRPEREIDVYLYACRKS
jgi:hypothetical protein